MVATEAVAPAVAIMVCKKSRRSERRWGLCADRADCGGGNGGENVLILEVLMKHDADGKILAINAANRHKCVLRDMATFDTDEATSGQLMSVSVSG